MSRVSRRRIASLAALCLAGLAAGGVAVSGQAERQRHVRASVLGKDDTPVTGLGVADFTVREDGATREVIGVTPATAPEHIVMLIDDAQATSRVIPFLRDGMKGFLERLADVAVKPQVRIVTFGDRPTLRIDFTSGTLALSAAADRIFPQTGAGSRFLDAVIETCRDLRTKHLDGVVIVAFVNEASPEFSDESHAHVAEALQAAGASLWTIALRDARGTGEASDADRERAMVIGDVTRDSGGVNATVLGPQGVSQAWTAVATRLTTQYDVLYGRPDRLVPPSRIAVAVRDRTAHVLVQRWAPR